MAKRRGNNEGSIYKRPDDTWRAQVTLDGRRLSFSSKKRKECQEWLREIKNQIDEGLNYESTKVSLQGFMETWLESSQATLKRSTLIHYNQVSKQYIFPELGDRKVIDLRTPQIQNFYNSLRTDNVGEHTIQKIHSVLHSALVQAVRSGLIVRNPASGSIPPTPKSREIRVLNIDQIQQLLRSAEGDQFQYLYPLAITTGMRQMELLGLMWIDVDWENQTIDVSRQLTRPNGKKSTFQTPKTKFGKRKISMGKKSISVLRDQHEYLLRQRERAGERWEEHGLVFPNSLGKPMRPRNLLRSFKILLDKAGLDDYRFHDLRHTSASLMLNKGIPLIIVSRRLGHSKPSITLDIYGHLIPGIENGAADLIDDLITIS